MLQRMVVAAALVALVPSVGRADILVEPPADPAPPQPDAVPGMRRGLSVPAARVHVRSTKPGTIVSRITGHMFVAGPGGAAAGISWKDLCMAPCFFEIEPGLHELMLKGDGHVPLVHQVQISSGDHYFVAKPGSMGVRLGGYALATVGLTAAVLGATFMLVPAPDDYNPTTQEFEATKRSWPLPVLLAGLGVSGIGIGMFIAARSSFESEFGPQVGQGTMVRKAISYSTSF